MAPRTGHLDTVCGKWPAAGPWVAQLGAHCAKIAEYHFRQLHLVECQLDELWTFVYKKEGQLTPLEQMLNLHGPSKGHFGDTWVWKVAVRGRAARFRGWAIAFAPMSKLVPAWVAGKRTLADGKKLIKCLKNRLDAHIPFFTSDDLPHYANALLDVYGQTIEPPLEGWLPVRWPRSGPLTGRPGRPRNAYKVPPESGPAPRTGRKASRGHDLLYAVVCKRREGSRVVEVTTETVYGTPDKVAQILNDSPTSDMISTYGVERNNLTISGPSKVALRGARPRGP